MKVMRFLFYGIPGVLVSYWGGWYVANAMSFTETVPPLNSLTLGVNLVLAGVGMINAACGND